MPQFVYPTSHPTRMHVLCVSIFICYRFDTLSAYTRNQTHPLHIRRQQIDMNTSSYTSTCAHASLWIYMCISTLTSPKKCTFCMCNWYKFQWGDFSNISNLLIHMDQILACVIRASGGHILLLYPVIRANEPFIPYILSYSFFSYSFLYEDIKIKRCMLRWKSLPCRSLNREYWHWNLKSSLQT